MEEKLYDKDTIRNTVKGEGATEKRCYFMLPVYIYTFLYLILYAHCALNIAVKSLSLRSKKTDNVRIT